MLESLLLVYHHSIYTRQHNMLDSGLIMLIDIDLDGIKVLKVLTILQPDGLCSCIGHGYKSAVGLNVFAYGQKKGHLWRSTSIAGPALPVRLVKLWPDHFCAYYTCSI